MTLDPDRVPRLVRDTRRWLGWRYEHRVDQTTGEVTTTKVPYAAFSRGRADVTKPANWTTFTKATDGYWKGRFDGVGFVLSERDSIMAIDLDHCRDADTGRIEGWAQRIIDAFQTYAEVSPSGTGVHIILKGRRPAGAGNRVGQIEIYESRRYLTVTGDALTTCRVVNDCQDALDALYVERWSPKPAKTASGPRRGGIALDDETLLRKARKDPRFNRLWRGDFTGYESQSEADVALLVSLAWWSNRNEEQMDRLFRDSGLYRTKWERADYRERCMQMALSSVRGGYGRGR